MNDAGTVEQHIDATELGDGAPDDFFHLEFFRDVGLKRQRAPALGTNFASHPLCFISVLIDDHTMRALAGKPIDDSAGARILRAGDEGNFVLQSHSIFSTWFAGFSISL